MQGTHGAELHAGLERARIAHVFQKGTDPAIDSYSGFFDNGHRKATGLGDWLNARGVTEVTVLGLATDYCVKFTALDARALGFAVTLVDDGCRAVNLAPATAPRQSRPCVRPASSCVNSSGRGASCLAWSRTVRRWRQTTSRSWCAPRAAAIAAHSPSCTGGSRARCTASCSRASPYRDAADLVQDMFAIALARLPQLAEPRRFRAGCSRSRAIAPSITCARSDPTEELVDISGSPRRAPPRSRRCSPRCASCPRRISETMILRLVEGMTGPEIAEQTGLSPGSVRVNLHRGMKLLRERLGITEGGVR